MKIQSNYYDIIDYLQDYDDEKFFLRKESTVLAKVIDWKPRPPIWEIFKDTDKRPLPGQFNTAFSPTQNVYENENLFNAVKSEQKELEDFPMKGTFHFLPKKLTIPISIFIKNKTIVIKKQDSRKGFCDYNSASIDFYNALDSFFKEHYQNFIWKCSVKPTWFITVPQYNHKHCHHNCYTLIWIHPPLTMIPDLLNHFSSIEELYQEIEQYLWNDVEQINPMKNISNNDRIIGHGFDLKTSFRKERKNEI